MKVVFAYPRFEKFLESIPSLDRVLVDHYLGNFTTPPSLGIPILAALTPPEWEIELLDDNSGDPVDFDTDADLIAINCFTPQATRAMELADGYRASGKTVVMGGFFPSAMPAEVLDHAGAVNIGDGEPTWLDILEDTKSGNLKKKYVGGTDFDLSKMPIPRRDLYYDKSNYDWQEDLVQVARGCTYNCSICPIPTLQSNQIRLRPVDKIVQEIKNLKYDKVYLAEDVPFFPDPQIEAWSVELFTALAPLEKKIFVTSTMALNTSDQFLDLIAGAGVNSFYCTFNTEPVSVRALSGKKAQIQAVVDLAHKLDDRGIRFFASFAMGRDCDGPGLADSILELCHKADIRTAEFFIYTPYPGSPRWDRFEKQGRILHRRWKEYNGAHVVARPLEMEPDALYEMFLTVWREFYRPLDGKAVVEMLEPDQSGERKQARRRMVGLEDE